MDYQSPRYIPVAETAKLVRTALKNAFPGIKFSVRSRSYAGGASIDIEYTDGPTTKDVDCVACRFSGATFDGMTDMKEYHTSEIDGEQVRYGADFIKASRLLSPAFLTRVAEAYCTRWNEPMPAIRVSSYDGSASFEEMRYHSVQEQVYKVAHTVDAQELETLSIEIVGGQFAKVSLWTRLADFFDALAFYTEQEETVQVVTEEVVEHRPHLTLVKGEEITDSEGTANDE